MKTQKRSGPAAKSKYQIELILTLEEAMAISDCEPAAMEKLSTFLTHVGPKKRAASIKK